VGADAAPEDTLAAFVKAADIIRRLKAGERFDSLSRQNSDDPASKNNGGDLYYFTGGQMVTPFENAAYAMKVGEVSALPVRSSFGYHIIKILDRGPARGSIKVRHIMARFKTMSPDSSDTAQALQRITILRDSLKKGADFATLAMKASEDQGSQQQGGDLGWFERRRWVLPFDEAAFKLKPGENSGIIRTPYGYHLLHCDSAMPPQSYDEVKDDLKKLYQQRRYNEDYGAYMDNIKNELRYRFDEGTFNSLVARMDSTKAVGDSAWDATVPADVRALALINIKGKDVSLDTVITILGNRPEFRNTPLRRRDLRARVDRIAESLLLETKAANLETRFPEFGVLMKEYNDGVILYKAEQMEVWNKTSINDSSLRAFYDLNKGKFMFPERVNIAELNVSSDTLAAKLYDSLSHGADFATLANRYNESPSPDKHGGERGLQPADSDTLTKRASALGVNEISEPFLSEDGGYTIIKLIARETPRVKSFDEAGAEVSNAYQEYLSKQLEQQWLDRIRLKYPVIQYKEELRNAFPSSKGSR
jgi:peptidyl-prolyl cis-trans isomerase SurA